MKLRLFLRFYGAKRRFGAKSATMSASVERAFSGFGEGEHNSKLQTAFRNGVTSALDCLKVRFKPAWMSARDERALFESWDSVYRRIRSQKAAQGVYAEAPADTAQLHLNNVIPLVRQDHETSRTFSAS
jgi:hypothetical protein